MRPLALLLCALGLTACLDPGTNITPPLGEDMSTADMDMAMDLAPDMDVEPVACTTVSDCDALPNTRGACMAGRCVYECDGGFKTPPDETLLADGCTCEVKPGACNGADDDCDGEVDEADELTRAGCEQTAGVCAGATRRCEAEESRYAEACDALDYAAHNPRYRDAQDEDWLCDGEDNDCDGAVDEVCCELGAAGRDPKERMPILTTPAQLLEGAHHLGVDASGQRIFSVSCAAVGNATVNDAAAAAELSESGEVIGSVVKQRLPGGATCAGIVSVVRDGDERNVIIMGDDDKLYLTKYKFTATTRLDPIAELLTPTPPPMPANANLSIYGLASASIQEDHVITWTETYTAQDQYVIRFMGCKIKADATRCAANKKILRELSGALGGGSPPRIKLFPVVAADAFHVISHVGGEQPQIATIAPAAMLPTTMAPLPSSPTTADISGVVGAGQGLLFLMEGAQGPVTSRYELDSGMMSPLSPLTISPTSASLYATPTGAIATYGTTTNSVSRMFTLAVEARGAAAAEPSLIIDHDLSDNLLGFYATALVPTARGALLQWSTLPSSGSLLYTLPLNAQGYPICAP